MLRWLTQGRRRAILILAVLFPVLALLQRWFPGPELGTAETWPEFLRLVQSRAGDDAVLQDFFATVRPAAPPAKPNTFNVLMSAEMLRPGGTLLHPGGVITEYTLVERSDRTLTLITKYDTPAQRNVEHSVLARRRAAAAAIAIMPLDAFARAVVADKQRRGVSPPPVEDALLSLHFDESALPRPAIWSVTVSYDNGDMALVSVDAQTGEITKHEFEPAR